MHDFSHHLKTRQVFRQQGPEAWPRQPDMHVMTLCVSVNISDPMTQCVSVHAIPVAVLLLQNRVLNRTESDAFWMAP